MDITEFRKDFLEQVKARASAGSNFTHAEFVNVCAEYLTDAEEITDFEVCYHRGTGSRNRSLAVDAFAQDEVDGSVRLVVADYSGAAEPPTVTSTSARTIFGRLI